VINISIKKPEAIDIVEDVEDVEDAEDDEENTDAKLQSQLKECSDILLEYTKHQHMKKKEYRIFMSTVVAVLCKIQITRLDLLKHKIPMGMYI